MPQRRREMLRGVDGIGSSGATNLGVRDHEVAIAFGCQAHHLQPMLRGRQFAFGFVRWRGGGHEIHQVQLQHLAHFFRRAQMSEMDRVEAAAEESYPQSMPHYKM